MAERRRVGPILRRALPALATLLILYLLYRSLDDPAALGRALLSADAGLLIWAVLLVLSNNLLVAAWEHLTVARALSIPLSLTESSLIKLVSYPLRVLLLKAADLNRAAYYQRRLGVELSLGVSATLLVPLLNLYLLIAACVLGGLLTRSDPLGLRLPLLALLVLAPLLAAIWFRWSSREPGSGRLAATAANLRRLLALPLPVWALLAAQTALCFLLQVGALSLFLRAVGLDVPFAVLVWAVPLVQVISNLPITLLGIGVREWTIAALLAAYGPREGLLAAGLLASTLDRVLLALLGLPALPWFVRSVGRR